MKLPSRIDRAIDSILGEYGQSTLSLRTAAFGSTQPETLTSDISKPVQDYIEKVRVTPYRVVDGDIDGLRNLGLSEDEIFEITVATALGTGVSRYRKTLAVLAEAQK